MDEGDTDGGKDGGDVDGRVTWMKVTRMGARMERVTWMGAKMKVTWRGDMDGKGDVDGKGDTRMEVMDLGVVG